MQTSWALRRTNDLGQSRVAGSFHFEHSARFTRASGRRGITRIVLAVIALTGVTCATAQTTTGTSSLGQNYFGLFNATTNPTGKGCAGCHAATTASLANAINAGGHITYANTQGMGGQADSTGQQYPDIAAYLATQFTAQATQSIPFQTATAFTIPNIVLNTTRGDYIGIRQVGAPAKGSANFTAGSLSVTYTPSAGQCGTDSFTYEAYRTGATFPQGIGTSNLRTTTVSISNPALPNISGSAGTIGGVFNSAIATFTPVNSGGTPLSYAITSGALPTGLSLAAGTGVISGTPSQAGNFSVTLAARNCNNGNLTGQSGTKVIAINIAQAAQTISFAALPGKLITDPPFTVSASGGASGLPVTFTASGVCNASGTNGSTITLTGVAGACAVTAAQGGNTNYAAASNVIQSFNVVDGGAEIFPPSCLTPPGWVKPATTPYGWAVASTAGDASQGSCGLKSVPMPLPPSGVNKAQIALTATFDAGTLSFFRRMDGEAGYDCFRLLIDDVPQPVGGSCNYPGAGISGVVPYGNVTVPISAGAHTVTFSYETDVIIQTALDAAWIDQVSMPLSTAVTSLNFNFGTFGSPISYTLLGSNFPLTYGATGLPPGLSINSSTGVVSGTPTAAGNFTAMMSVSNPAGVNPAASDTKAVSFSIAKAGQNINFPAINNRLTTAPAFAVSASGGGSGNPVTFTASGVCTSGGTNGATITLTGAVGTCTVSASQLGNANYNDTAGYTQSFSVTPASSEIFPPACAMPAGWTNTAGPGWTVSANEESATGACSLKSVSTVGGGTRYQTEISYSGTFATGNVTFKYRISTEPNYKCFQFFIDGVAQNLLGGCSVFGLVGISGETGWVSVSFPITAGVRTLRWRYDKDSDCCTGGTRDAVWIDDVVMPQFTLTVTKAGPANGTISSTPAGINSCSGTCSTVISGNVLLTPTPGFLGVFAGWSGGGCSGTGTCTVTMDASKSVTGTFNSATPPGALQNVVATPANGGATITFNPPASDGGSPITSYGGNCAASGQTTVFAGGSNSPTPLVFSGMTNGVQYACTVAASNFAGTGASTVVNVTPRTVPAAPTGLSAAAGNTSVILTFTLSASNGGATISAYNATCSAAGQTTRTGTAAGSPITVASLVNGVQYSCSVVATNVAGNSTAATVNVTPQTVPSAPTGVVLRNFDGRAVVDFIASASDGGSPISGYSVTCTPGPVTFSNTASPITLTGLTNGVTLTCSLVATNGAGNSTAVPLTIKPDLQSGGQLFGDVCSGCHAGPPATPQFNAAGTTPAVLNYVIANVTAMAGTPTVVAMTAAERTEIAKYLQSQIPTAPVVTAFNTAKSIDLIDQISIGSISFEALEIVGNPANGTLSAFTGTSITYTPTNGFTGTNSFTFRGKRTMPASLVGDTRTVNITVSPPPVPVVTSALTASGTNGSAFSYQILATNSPTGYAANGLPSGVTVNPMTGLISGTPSVGGTFNASIAASNQGGSGLAVTLVITLSPTGQVITFPAQTTASRNFVPSPGNTFDLSPVATASSGLPLTYVTKTPAVCSIAGITVTVIAAGTCTIGANQAGNLSFTVAAEVTRSVTILAVAPTAPLSPVATPGNLQATIGFSPPASNGGATISLYSASCTPSGAGTNAVSPITITGLANGTTYTCTVTAANSAGTGPASASVTVTPAPTPTAPIITSANTTTFTVNAPGSFAVSASGNPTTFTYGITGSLPAGVTFSTVTGVLSGTPTTAGVNGMFPLTFTVSNGVGSPASQPFTLNVAKANQTISFANPGTQAFSITPVPLSAAATSTLAVTILSDTTGVCTISGATAVLVSAGTCTIRAQQAGNGNFNAAPEVTQSFSVVQGGQTINFPAQTSPRAYVAGSSFGLTVANASSGLPVSYSSLTLAVCTISGSTVSMVRAGTCTIAANQSGNASVSAAAQVTQSIVFTGALPGAPTLNSATPGSGKITLAFTPPASDGGSSITLYTATCGAATGTGSSSPVVVSGLMNGSSYMCSVTATNATGTGTASNVLSATPAASAGASVWAATCGTAGCHGTPPNPTPDPTGTRLNVGGTTTDVLDYVIPRQPVMNLLLNGATPMSAADRLAVANYIADFIPAVSAITPFNTAVGINVGSQVYMSTAIAAFTSLQVVSAPAHGTLSAFSGTNVTYTPTIGYVGSDSFTYRATQAGLNSDVRTVTVTVQPAAPTITSALSASGTIGTAFSYQIAATNAPTSYAATGLPANLTINTSTGLISGTPAAGGSTPVTISATSGGLTGSDTLTINISLIPQVITFGAQASPVVFVNGGTFMIAPLASGGASGNPIVYSSTTTGVCNVSGSTVNMLSAGICTIAANQAGSATYAAATQVTRSVTITGIAPAAPTIGAATAGNTQASIGFTPPTNTGGLPITGYTVSCNSGTVTASGGASPIVVSGLINGTPYTCSVQASNLAGSSVPSVTVSVTPVAIAFTGTVESRKLHGVAGMFPIPINPATPLNGAIAIEPRTIGNGHQIAFTFNNPPTSLTGLTVLDAGGQPVGSPAPSFAGNDLIITLTGVPDGKRVTITATGVNNALTVSASVGFLYGDVNGSGSVTATDIAYIKALSAQPFNGAKFKADINANGTVTASDVTAVKAQAGKTLP